MKNCSNSKWPNCGHFRSTNFHVNAIHSTFFYVSLLNLYHISISLKAWNWASFGQKLGHGGQNGRLSAVIFVMCVISGKPDQIARPLLLNNISNFGQRYTMTKFKLILTSICVITGKPCQIVFYYWTKCAVFVLHAANYQFSDNFNNGDGLLSSVLLFQMIFTFKRWLFPSPTGIVIPFY